MLRKVISGGQTGVDQAALRAARAAGIPTGGLVPRGWRTDDGAAPWLADFGLTEHPSSDYRQRTLANVRAAGLVALLYADGLGLSPGTCLTRNGCAEYGVECFEAPFYPVGGAWRCGELRPLALADTIRRVRPSVLNVAGNRERNARGIGAAAEAFLADVFAALKERPS